MTNAALYIRKLRKLPHANQTSCGDMIEIINMLRAGDLTHVDEGSEAASRADRAEIVDAPDLLDGDTIVMHYTHGAAPDDFSATLSAIRIGDLWLTRDQAVAMLGQEHVERIDNIATREMEENQ